MPSPNPGQVSPAYLPDFPPELHHLIKPHLGCHFMADLLNCGSRGLTALELDMLNGHLAACPHCQRYVAALQGTN